MKQIGILLACLVFLTACAGINPALQLESRNGVSELTITFSERDVRGLMNAINTSGGQPLIRNAVVDLRDGELLARGQVRDGSTGRYYNGSLAAELGAENGWLTVTLTALSYNNWRADAVQLAESNAAIAKALADAAKNNTSGISLSGISISDTAMVVKLSAPSDIGGLPGNLQLETTEATYLVTFRMSPENVRAVLFSVFAAGDQAWFLNPVVTLGSDTLTISGALRGENGDTVAVVMTLRFAYRGGQVDFAITSLRLNNWDVPESILKPINEGIFAGLVNLLTPQRNGSQITLLTLAKDGLTFQLSIPRR